MAEIKNVTISHKCDKCGKEILKGILKQLEGK